MGSLADNTVRQCTTGGISKPMKDQQNHSLEHNSYTPLAYGGKDPQVELHQVKGSGGTPPKSAFKTRVYAALSGGTANLFELDPTF